MMIETGNPNHYYRGWGRYIRKKFKTFLVNQWVKANWASWEDCLKIKHNEKSKPYSSRALTQCIQSLNSNIKVMGKKQQLLLDCLGSCFSSYLYYMAGFNLQWFLITSSENTELALCLGINTFAFDAFLFYWSISPRCSWTSGLLFSSAELFWWFCFFSHLVVCMFLPRVSMLHLKVS